MGVESDNSNNLVAIQNWLRTKQHLPQNIDPILLRRFIQSVHGDLEKAKKLIDLSYTMRNNHANIFLKRDPHTAESKIVLEVTDMLPLPYATKENYKVLLYRLADTDPDKFNFTEAIKMFFMVADVRMVSGAVDEPNAGWNGEVPIFDMAGFSLRHLTRVVLSVLRVYMKYTQEAHPVRLRQIHIINCVSYVDRVLSLVKPFMKNEVLKLIHFHTPGSETLYKFVPKDLLPNEYGGKAGHIKEIKGQMLQNLNNYRDYLMDDSRWKLSSTLRGCENGKTEPEMTGNFRTLCID